MRIQNSIIEETPYRSSPQLNADDDMVKVDLRISKIDWVKVKRFLKDLNK